MKLLTGFTVLCLSFNVYAGALSFATAEKVEAVEAVAGDDNGYCSAGRNVARACNPSEKMCGTTTYPVPTACGYNKDGKCVATASTQSGTFYCQGSDPNACGRYPAPTTRALVAACVETTTDRTKECALVTKTQTIACGETVRHPGNDGVIFKNTCHVAKDEKTCLETNFSMRIEDSAKACELGAAKDVPCVWIKYRPN